MILRGSFRVLILYDVADAIRLEDVRRMLPAGAASTERIPGFTHPSPEYVRFERPPVLAPVEPVTLETGERFEARISYYDYGVLSVGLESRFEGGWEDLIRSSSRLIGAPEIEKRVMEVVRPHAARVRAAMVNPYESWLSEDYYITHLSEAIGDDGKPLTAAELIETSGDQITRIIRGEAIPLSETERTEILQSSISYYPADLLVVGWTAALVYDTPAGAWPVIQLLEYANTQLLEFRYYDELLTRVLEDVYRSLERGAGTFSRWRLAREAGRLNTIRLDVIELAERIDNSIKFLSDMFYSRLYRLAAAKVGVPDYRELVEKKLRTAGELYQFMVDQFQQGRAFLLESAVVIILLIELLFLFRGK